MDGAPKQGFGNEGVLGFGNEGVLGFGNEGVFVGIWEREYKNLANG